jgi:hypothetical protein
MGPMFIPQMIYEYGEPWRNDINRRKTKKPGEKHPSQCYFDHHKSHMD